MVAVLAFAVFRSYAQGNGMPSFSYTNMTYEDCSSMPKETMVTIINNATVTYLSEFMMASSSQVGYTSVYTTTSEAFCSTGVVNSMYTVTESGTEPTITWTSSPSHIPQAFIITALECSVCGNRTKRCTITEPCVCPTNERTKLATNTEAATNPATGVTSPTPPDSEILAEASRAIQSPASEGSPRR